MDPGTVGVFIPIIALGIPLVAVIGRFIVQPVIAAVLKHAEMQKTAVAMEPMAQRLAETEDRLERIERTMQRVIEEQEFQRQLTSGSSETPALTKPG